MLQKTGMMLPTVGLVGFTDGVIFCFHRWSAGQCNGEPSRLAVMGQLNSARWAQQPLRAHRRSYRELCARGGDPLSRDWLPSLARAARPSCARDQPGNRLNAGQVVTHAIREPSTHATTSPYAEASTAGWALEDVTIAHVIAVNVY